MLEKQSHGQLTNGSINDEIEEDDNQHIELTSQLKQSMRKTLMK
jgi:hypothetical protein